MLAALGRLREAEAVFRSAYDVTMAQAGLRPSWAAMGPYVAQFQAQSGIRREELFDYRKPYEAALAMMAAGSFEREQTREQVAGAEREIDLAFGDYRAVLDASRKAIERIRKLKTINEGEVRQVAIGLAVAHKHAAIASYRLGDFATAEADMRASIGQLERLPIVTILDKVNVSEHRVLLAQAVARQARAAEAAKLVEPELAFNRDLVKRGSEDLRQHALLAQAVFVSALSLPPERRARITESAKMLQALPAEMTKQSDVARLRAEIAEEAKR
jgi:hypothetical protein